MTEFRVIFTGSRSWSDYKFIREVMSVYKDRELVVVHGGCKRGADLMVNSAAYDLIADHGYRWLVEPHPADWDGPHGRAAGPVRNEEMARLGAKLCIAFWDGSSKGTLHMMQCALRHGIPVHTYSDIQASLRANNGSALLYG